MPVVFGRTREQMRVAIGYNLMGAGFFVSSTTSASDSSSVIDTAWKGGSDDAKGYWVVSVEGQNDGEIRRATDDNGSGDITVDAFSNNVPNSMSYELWKEEYPPTMIHSFMDQAVTNTAGRAFDPVESLALHFENRTARFDIPSGFTMLKSVEFRSYVTSVLVHECDRTFDETTDSDFTQATDTEDRKHGSGSLKLTIAASAAAGDFITDSITAVDLSKYTHIEGWAKATTSLAAGDFVLHLDNGVVQADGTDLESLNVPATIADDTWTYFRVTLANPDTDSAIVSIGFEHNVDKGANTVWFDHVKAVVNDSAQWDPLPTRLWYIDKEASDLIIKPAGVGVTGYSLMKLIGGDTPALLASDSSTSEVSDQYIVAYATAMALTASGDNRAGYWLGRANKEYAKLPLLVDVRETQ